MASSKIMLAVAGSGKTYYIANHLNPLAKNIVVTFTNQNVANLKKEIRKANNGEIPNETLVITFSSFVYRWLLKPFEPILKVGNQIGVYTTGVEIERTPEPQSINQKLNPKYYKKDDIRHYIYFQKYYVSRMSALFNDQPNYVKKIIYQRLTNFCDCIYFDELQDFMDNDFKVLLNLLKNKNTNVLAVGDFYQHSVCKSTLSSKPFKQGKYYLTKEDYKALFNGDITIDETTLINSRRVPKVVCDFINDKLSININSISEIRGNIELLDTDSKINKILTDNKVVKLFYKESKKYNCIPNINWGYSKGDTYKRTCIILTQKFDSLFDEDFSSISFSPTQINTIYVAITRSTHEVYFIKEKDFKRLKPHYLID